ncbi:(2Fe-2S)-binding protein [Actinoplanes sp. NPDC051851]|uniref:(2Fe-2S)-binding protein n=1 Tax=Actinoplanes sp. NPDC051851 TaxID=3154753 RepID=UPI003429E169
MYVCICNYVREREVRAVIRDGARTEEEVGDACGAGTGCGSCLDRICELIEDEEGPDTRMPFAA